MANTFPVVLIATMCVFSLKTLKVIGQWNWSTIRYYVVSVNTNISAWKLDDVVTELGFQGVSNARCKLYSCTL